MSNIDVIKYATKEALEAELVKNAQAQADALWQASEKSRRLANLHQELGFRTTRDLIAALQQLGGATTAVAGKKKEGKRTRTTITDAIRNQVKELAASGKKAPSIAKQVGVSTPTVYKILG